MRLATLALLLILAACTSKPPSLQSDAPPPFAEKSAAITPQECGAVPCPNPPEASRPPVAEPTAKTKRPSEEEPSKALTDSEVGQRMIAESIAVYLSSEGSCPCPYNREKGERNSLCGDRSAYIRSGGQRPLCYEGDVSAARLEAYRKANNIPKAEEPKVF